MHKVAPRLTDQLLDGFSLRDKSIVGCFFSILPSGDSGFEVGSVDYLYIQYAQCIKDSDLHAVDFFVKVYWVNLGWMDVAVQSFRVFKIGHLIMMYTMHRSLNF